MPRDFEIQGRFGKVTINIVAFATIVTPELIMEIAPHLVKRLTEVNPRFDATHGDVVTSNVTQLGKVTVAEEIVIAKPATVPAYNELLRDGLFEKFKSASSFMWPGNIPPASLRTLAETGVPEVAEFCFGINQYTKERFMAYGTYSAPAYNWSTSATPFWTLNREEAEQKRSALLSLIPARIVRQPVQQTRSWIQPSVVPATLRPAPMQAPAPVAPTLPAAAPVTAKPAPAGPLDLVDLGKLWGAQVR